MSNNMQNLKIYDIIDQLEDLIENSPKPKLSGSATKRTVDVEEDFDLLGDASIHSITVSGIRCQDMRLRMKYVDIPVMLEENVETAIRKRIEDGVGNLYVLVNYTALFSTHNILKKMEGEKE